MNKNKLIHFILSLECFLSLAIQTQDTIKSLNFEKSLILASLRHYLTPCGIVVHSKGESSLNQTIHLKIDILWIASSSATSILT